MTTTLLRLICPLRWPTTSATSRTTSATSHTFFLRLAHFRSQVGRNLVASLVWLGLYTDFNCAMERSWRAIRDWESWRCCGRASSSYTLFWFLNKSCQLRSSETVSCMVTYVIFNGSWKKVCISYDVCYIYFSSVTAANINYVLNWHSNMGTSTSNMAFCLTATYLLVLTVDTLFALELRAMRSCQWAGRCRDCLVWGVRRLGHGRATTDLAA